MENKTATKKKTLKNYYEEIIEMATALDNKEIVDFCKDRIEKLDHKNGKKKMTKTQEENEVLKETLLLAITEEPQTITELQEITGLQDLSNQKVTALLRQLIEAEKIEREVIKRKAHFKLKTV